MTFFKKATLATALVATTMATASPAMADSYRGHRGGGDSTGAAIAGGIIGLALGAIIVSSGNRHNNRYADRGWQYRDGYYWDRAGHRYDRDGRPCDEDGYYSRRGYNDRGYNDRGSYDRGGQGYRYGDRGYSNGDRGHYGRDNYYGDRTYRQGY